jgi:surface antigen
MSVSLKAIVVAVAAFSAVSAQAQLLGPDWQVDIQLTQHDIDLIHATANHVHGKPVGTTAYWNNPASGNSGAITLEKKLVVNNQKCEEIRYFLRSSKPSTYPEDFYFTTCLQPDGTWKIAF